MSLETNEGLDSDNQEDSNQIDQGDSNSQQSEAGVSNDSPNGEEGNKLSNEELSPNWQEDKRYETFWKKDPNELYGSYKTLEQKLQENGSRIKEYEGEVDNLKTSSQEANEVLSYIESMKDHPEFSSKLSELVDGYNKALRNDKYGDNLPDKVYDKLSEIDTLKEEAEKVKEEKLVAEQGKIIDSQLAEIKKVAEKYNIEYGEAEFGKWCLDNNISPSNMKAYFMDHAFEHIEKSITHKTQSNVIKNINSNKAANLSQDSTKTKSGLDGSMSFMDKMKEKGYLS